MIIFKINTISQAIIIKNRIFEVRLTSCQLYFSILPLDNKYASVPTSSPTKVRTGRLTYIIEGDHKIQTFWHNECIWQCKRKKGL